MIFYFIDNEGEEIEMQVKPLRYLAAYERALVLAAQEASKNAYAPYSKYQVGAAALDETGNLHVGCNVENAAYTGLHGEDGAIAHLAASGARKVRALACYTKDGGTLCGNCRQKVWQMCDGDSGVLIYIMNEQEMVTQFTIGELLPYPFELPFD